jgi:serine/threonine-protein kinase
LLFKKKKKLTRLKVHAIGGFARLTLAEEPDGNQVILRELLPQYLWNWRMRRRFMAGVRIRQRLSGHPQIVSSLEQGHAGFQPYEVIEYVPGKNLHELIRTKDELARTHAAEILRQAATALAFVHEQGFLHLDVKAANFLLDSRSAGVQVKLTDFDLACSRGYTGGNGRAGTLKYMPPEQVVSGCVGEGSDIFALGVLAYRLVAGVSPFPGTSETEIRRRQLNSAYLVVPPSKVRPGLSHKLEWIIMRCLEKDPSKRFPHMSYLCQELQKL